MEERKTKFHIVKSLSPYIDYQYVVCKFKIRKKKSTKRNFVSRRKI